MNDKQIDELIDKVLQEDQILPEGLSERLEQQIDAWATTEKKETMRSSFRRRSLYWFSGAAAVALLCVGIFQFVAPEKENQLADTYTNPQEAAIAAQKALAFMSVNLNKGIEQVNEAQQEMNKVNNILNKHLKD
ncbi:hypothetical protein [uncultured Parabacteroides sp.]|jgi:bacteriorhodopsin|uniref:hypothetical protein n=1 Tax=uncultured Parabacteroides sp. TaxID=512312 RepID=UPI0025EEB7E6|nr:hypothetical protein [uncultured Parabacteroides sp.]